MEKVGLLLAAERELERRFVVDADREPNHPSGWTAALLMFHLYSWRERLYDALRQARQGRAVPIPPDDIDEFNNAELAKGAGISLGEAGTRSDVVLGELIGLWDVMGDRPFRWYVAETTGEALIRNSYHHPRIHLAEHFLERGDRARGRLILEESASELRGAQAPPHTLGAALYNLACLQVADGQLDPAMALLEEALPMRADLRMSAATDPDLARLRNEPRFRAILNA